MKKTLVTLAVLALGTLGVYLYISFRTADSSPADAQNSEVPALTKEYKNEQYRFSLKMPEAFEAREMDGAVVLEDQEGDGIQILVSPFDEDLHELTKERIRQDVPDLVITEVQPVTIGPEHTGLAFKSDNDAFAGASREVWFVFRGNLYQISTYERLDPLLKAIFATWEFY